jgi:hypothetical protein
MGIQNFAANGFSDIKFAEINNSGKYTQICHTVYLLKSAG